MVERIGEQVERIGGDRRLVLLSRGVTVTDKETGEKERHAHGGRARVVGQQAGLRGIEAGVELGEMFERPKCRVRLRGIRVVKNRVRRRRGAHLLAKISGVKTPREIPGMPRAILQKRRGCADMRCEVAECIGMREREGQRGGGVVETVEFDAKAGVCLLREGLENRDRIRRGSEADIPNHEWPDRFHRPLDEPLLAHMERDRFRHRADDGMKGLAKFPRTQAARAGLDGDEFKTGAIFARHARNVMRHSRNPQGLC